MPEVEVVLTFEVTQEWLDGADSVDILPIVQDLFGLRMPGVKVLSALVKGKVG